jgi:hypothetical protein
MKPILAFFIITILLNQPSSAQVDTINAQNHSLQISKLKEGTTNYLVYFTDSLYNLQGSADIWKRSIHFGSREDQPIVEFDWKWFRCDSLLADVKNICDRNTLAPVFHKAVYPGKGVIAYDFKNGKMIPSDTVANNAVVNKAGVPLDLPVISWEEDLETYPLYSNRKRKFKTE